MRTFAEPALMRAPQQTSSRQSKRHYVTKVRTQRKTASALGSIWDRANERRINGVVVFTFTADGKQSDGAEIMFMDEV
ncbi:hypothetical protein PO909_014888 [Leuciscus waleckii]